MPTLDERIARETQKLEQLKRQKKAQEAREKKNKRKIDTRRQIIIGGIVAKYFPEVLKFEPKYNNAENYIEFAPLANFLSVLNAQKDFVTQLKELAKQKANAQATPEN